MKIIKIFLLSLPLFFVQAVFAIGDYTFPQDVTTDTDTFPVKDEEEVQRKDEARPLEMQKEETETDLDSFGQDKFNENVDPNKLDTTKDTY